VVVLILMGFDYPIGTWTLASLLVIVPALAIGWRAARPGIERLARERARAGGGTVAR